jgi:hypothetical protein
MAKDESGIPHNMRRVYRRLQRWRSSHTGRLPIPESLWAAAAELARGRIQSRHLFSGGCQPATLTYPTLVGKNLKGSDTHRTGNSAPTHAYRKLTMYCKPLLRQNGIFIMIIVSVL